MKQKDIFSSVEGDAWFNRNKSGIAKHSLPNDDPVLIELLELKSNLSTKMNVLEIGCGNGARLSWLKDNFGLNCFGIDPSDNAVAYANKHGIEAQKGTADKLPFQDNKFDVVIFGFCLYLCDREDLFRIAMEADRVLQTPGWLLIYDFYSPSAVKCKYKHKQGVFSYKMDYKSLFSWHPGYECMTNKIRHHEEQAYTDGHQDWVAVSVLRKNYTDVLT